MISTQRRCNQLIFCVLNMNPIQNKSSSCISKHLFFVMIYEKFKPEIKYQNFLLVNWLTPLLWKGSFGKLDATNLWSLPENLETANVLSSFDFNQSDSLTNALIISFKRTLGQALILDIIAVGCRTAIPIALQVTIDTLDSKKPYVNGVVMAIVLATLQIFLSLSLEASRQLTSYLMIKTKSILVSTIYEKSLLSKTVDKGIIINFVIW